MYYSSYISTVTSSFILPLFVLPKVVVAILHAQRWQLQAKMVDQKDKSKSVEREKNYRIITPTLDFTHSDSLL